MQKNQTHTETYEEKIGYTELDAFKQRALGLLVSTFENNDQIEIEESSLGESAIVAWLKAAPHIGIAFTLEGLGTKNIAAQLVYEKTGNPEVFNFVSKCNHAMIVNDIITVGARAAVANMELAVGHKDWMNNLERQIAIIEGWTDACNIADMVYGGGETPTLKEIVSPQYPVMSGAAWGTVQRNQYLHGELIRPGDQIIFIASSGIHANGLTDAREVAEMLSDGYLTQIAEGLTYAEALLVPTISYAPLLNKIHDRGLSLHYAVNITGHGFKKLARPKEIFKYVIHSVSTPSPLFRTIKTRKKYTDSQMYQIFNMGVGFALYVSDKSVKPILDIAQGLGYHAWHAGQIEAAKEKSVVIKQVGVTYTGNTFDH